MLALHHWFDARDHMVALVAFIDMWEGPALYTCLDLFGAAQSLAGYWRARGFAAIAWDIELGGAMCLRPS